jgi:D,D-heptose 1,7-bisphosphate phosphatase
VAAEKRRAVFLDRDGTLIIDRGYLRDPEDISFLPGAVAALAGFQRLGLLLFVVSNQSGIGRGLITDEDAGRVHERFVRLLADGGVRLDGIYYCPHTPDAGCACRKPLPGMLLRAAQDFALDMESSVMIGDKPTDVMAGRNAGCRTILFAARCGAELSCRPDWVADDWHQLEGLILVQKGVRHRCAQHPSGRSGNGA